MKLVFILLTALTGLVLIIDFLSDAYLKVEGARHGWDLTATAMLVVWGFVAFEYAKHH